MGKLSHKEAQATLGPFSGTENVMPINYKKEKSKIKNQENNESKMNFKNQVKPAIKNVNNLKINDNDEISKMINKDSNVNESQKLKNELFKSIINEKNANSILKQNFYKNEESITDVLSQPLIKWNDQSHATCDICKKDIVLGKNLSGLVVEEKFFACESCCINSTNNELFNWTKKRMKTPSGVRPIGVWITQKNSQDKSILFRK